MCSYGFFLIKLSRGVSIDWLTFMHASIWHNPSYGFLPVYNSSITQPKLHISLLKLSTPPSYSGLMNLMVPFKSWPQSWLILDDIPRSINLHVYKSYVNMILSGFISLWIISFECRYSIADISWKAMFFILS